MYPSSPSLNKLQLGLLTLFSHYYVNFPGYVAGSVLVLIIEVITSRGLKG